MNALTKSEEARFFEVIDAYSRSQYRCFVSEMFPNETATEYVLCFRPVDAQMESPNRYACQYARIKNDEVRSVGAIGVLPDFLVERLMKELSRLKQTNGGD